MLADMARERANPPQSCTNRRSNFFIGYGNRMTTSDGANPQPQLVEQITSGYIPGHLLRIRKNSISPELLTWTRKVGADDFLPTRSYYVVIMSEQQPDSTRPVPASRLTDRFSILQGIRPFQWSGVSKNLLAGITLAAMNIPQSLGYTKIAGTPVITGLYTLLFPLVAFSIFGSSRYLVVAADSATAAILASSLTGVALIASPRYVALAGLVAFLTGIFLLLARLLKLGFFADFLSQTVLLGFLVGVGFQVGIAVLGEMLGINVHSRRTPGQILEVLRSLPHVHLLTMGISFAVVAAILLCHRVAPSCPLLSLRLPGQSQRAPSFTGYSEVLPSRTRARRLAPFGVA
jgi:hypothetical protein